MSDRDLARWVLVALIAMGALAFAISPYAARAATVEITVKDNFFEPATVSATGGDTLRWRFDSPQMQSTHNVTVIPPTGAPGIDVSGDVGPGSPPAEFVVGGGSWSFFCRIHSPMIGFANVAPGSDTAPPTTTATLDPASPGPGGTYDSGPVEVALTASDGAGSGVTLTEYRLAGAPMQPYSGPITLTAPGPKQVQFRSRDVGGNVEQLRSVGFTIAPPMVTPPATPLPTTPPQASLRLNAGPEKLKARALAAGVGVTASCEGTAAGTARLVAGKAAATQLGIAAGALASATLPACAGLSTAAELVPSTKAARALRKLRGTLRLTVEMRAPSSAGGELVDATEVTVKGKRDRR